MSVAVTWPFQRVYAQLGLGSDVVTRATTRFGISLAQFADPSTRISTRDALTDLERFARFLHRSDLGLLAAQAVVPGDFGTLEMAARTCSTVREALSVLANGYELLVEGVHLGVEMRSDRVVLRMWSDPEIDMPPAGVEYALLAITRLALQYAPEVADPECVRFEHARVSHAAACETAFGAPVTYDSFENALEWQAERLEVRTRTANPPVGRALRAHVDKLVAAIPSRMDIVGRIEQVIARRLDAGQPSFDAVARSLGLSKRTLHRKLRAAGRSYRDIGNALRIRMAVHHLEQTGSSLKEIASMLGFRDVSSFHRAFKRATGKTPTERRVTRAGESTSDAGSASAADGDRAVGDAGRGHPAGPRGRTL